jgi:hypothetical protein
VIQCKHFVGDGSLKPSHSSLNGLQFPILSNDTSPSLIAIDVISPLTFLIVLKLGGPSHAFVSPVLNPQVVALFDVVVPLFPSFVEPSSNGSIHVDSLATSFENVVILSDLLDTK